MLTIGKMKLAVYTAIESGLDSHEDLQELLLFIGAPPSVQIIGSGEDKEITTLNVDGVVRCSTTSAGEIDYQVLKEQHTPAEKQVIGYQIELYKERKKSQALTAELDEKKALIESGITSFDRPLNDARNLIECYEGMASTVEKNRDATLTIFENIEPFLGDADALYTILTQVVHIWENTTTDPTAYDPIPF